MGPRTEAECQSNGQAPPIHYSLGKGVFFYKLRDTYGYKTERRTVEAVRHPWHSVDFINSSPAAAGTAIVNRGWKWVAARFVSRPASICQERLLSTGSFLPFTNPYPVHPPRTRYLYFGAASKQSRIQTPMLTSPRWPPEAPVAGTMNRRQLDRPWVNGSHHCVPWIYSQLNMLLTCFDQSQFQVCRLAASH